MEMIGITQSSQWNSNVIYLRFLKAILIHAKDNPEKKILIAGHTDRSGSDDYNFLLSQKRAESIVALLVDDRDSWITLVNESHADEDIQHLMKWIAGFKGWSCDPGAVDGIIGTNTKNAIKVFQ
ncbi:MAG: OmpA family protein, partial [Desulfobacterales bacterium]|nr:OmpA family protein [Desulfobacterales bacterium]